MLFCFLSYHPAIILNLKLSCGCDFQMPNSGIFCASKYYLEFCCPGIGLGSREHVSLDATVLVDLDQEGILLGESLDIGFYQEYIRLFLIMSRFLPHLPRFSRMKMNLLQPYLHQFSGSRMNLSQPYLHRFSRRTTNLLQPYLYRFSGMRMNLLQLYLYMFSGRRMKCSNPIFTGSPGGEWTCSNTIFTGSPGGEWTCSNSLSLQVLR